LFGLLLHNNILTDDKKPENQSGPKRAHKVYTGAGEERLMMMMVG
jgi:hypothetical protein